MKKIIIKLWFLISCNLFYSMENHQNYIPQSYTPSIKYSLKKNVIKVLTFCSMSILSEGGIFLKKNHFLKNNNCINPIGVNEFCNKFNVKIVDHFDKPCNITKNNNLCLIDSDLENFGSFCGDSNSMICNPNECEIKYNKNSYILDNLKNNIPCLYNISINQWLDINDKYKLIIKKKDQKITEPCNNPNTNNNCKNYGVFYDITNNRNIYNGKFCFNKNNNETNCDFVNDNNETCIFVKKNDVKVKGTFLNSYNEVTQNDVCMYSTNLQDKIIIFFNVNLSLGIIFQSIQLLFLGISYFFLDAKIPKDEFDKLKDIPKKIYNHYHRRKLHYINNNLLIYELWCLIVFCTILAVSSGINQDCKDINKAFLPTLAVCFLAIAKLSGPYCHNVKFFKEKSSELFYIITSGLQIMCCIYLLLN